MKRGSKTLLFLLLFYPTWGVAKTTVVESVLALVNEEPIYKTEFEQFRERLKQGLYDDLVIRNEEERQKALKNPEYLLEQLIQAKVIDSEINKMEFEVPQEQIEQEIRKIASQNDASVSQLISELKRQGIKLEEYREMIRKNIKRRVLMEREISSQVKITEADLADYIQKNYSDQVDTEVFEYDLSHIVIQTSNRSDEEALKRANRVYDQLKKGANFSELASDYSEDPNFSTGGVLGTFSASDLSSSFQKVLKSLNTGEFSKPAKSPMGYHVLELNNKRLIPNPQVDALKQSAQEELYARNFQKQFEFWMNQKRQQATVRINTEIGKESP